MKYETVHQLHDELERQKNVNVDYIAETGDVHFITFDGKPGLYISIVEGDNQIVVPLNDWAIGQGANKISETLNLRGLIPYTRSCIEKKRYELVATNFNKWLPSVNKSWCIRTTETSTVPTLNYPATYRFARAVLSNKFRFLENLSALTVAMETIRDIENETGDTIGLHRMNMNDQYMYLKFRSDETYTLDGDDHFYPGVLIKNSEVGGATFKVQPMFSRQVCGNDMVSVTAFAQRHLGESMEAGVVRWSEETQVKTLEANKSKIQDCIRSAFDPDFYASWFDAIARGVEFTIEDRAETLDAMRIKFPYSDRERDNLLSHFGNEKRTLFGTANAFTRYAQDISNEERRIEFETFGGIVATMKPDEYNSLLKTLRENEAKK